ncbi:hypothetical protein RchiOBHm_Chr5g0041621 [Rosa chinensis]|uniref:Uncharacterized protein n=1 Tax=Rosa chinensis TaxID=74649 RepID=A0A2P6QCV0_ROSCH|nr:hypothetical protein RchiOBHm_Chr5g0041621 [Rosa chinensis]
MGQEICTSQALVLILFELLEISCEVQVLKIGFVRRVRRFASGLWDLVKKVGRMRRMIDEAEVGGG